MSYDRVLPKPAALHYEATQVTLPPRQTSNLLEHKIMNDDFSNKVAILDHPHSHLPHHAADGYVHSLPQIHHLSSINRAQMTFNQLASSGGPMESYKPIAPLPTTTTTKDIPIRERSSQSERSSSSSPVKSSSSSREQQQQQQPAAQFCLCQPDPKIPRPRNAFILYRQHYQAAVVAQNPGLANPDISKIIGEQWRKLPQETKDEWKALAEEEKARHQQQYPEYRYQPRRYGRDGNQRSNGAGVSHTPSGSVVCNRCGGRIMNPPVSPETPFTPNGSSANGAPASHPETLVRSYQCRTKDADRPPNPIRLGSNGEPRPSRRQWDESGCQSPDSKRRRFNPQFPFKANINRDKSPDSPYPMSPYGQRSDGPQTRNGGGMLQMLHLSRPYTNGKEHSPHDPSLKLPPLQTTAAAPGMMTPITPFPQNGSSLETTVMTIPFLNKIKVLAKISPPLFRDPASQQQRGAVIAVDGQDPGLVKSMVEYLDSVLHKEGKYNVRTFDGPDVRSREASSESGQMGDATVDYLDTISAWHRISDEVVSFVRPSTGSPVLKPAEEEIHSGVSPKTILPETANLKIGSPTQSSENGSATTASPLTTSGNVPVALVPRYQLTTADAFACSIPIHDSYAPLDHWQWMASLWRACVGPDITVYVRECEKDELDRLGGNPVEVRLHDARTVVIRKAAGSPKGLEEKAMRRVGFEIEDLLTQ